MSTVRLSDREIFGVFSFLKEGGNWGGGEDLLATQYEVWSVLKLEKFATLKASATMLDLSDELHEYELSAKALELLRACLSRPGQVLAFGVRSAEALARMKATEAVAQK